LAFVPGALSGLERLRRPLNKNSFGPDAKKKEQPFVYADAWFCTACGAGHGTIKEKDGERMVLFEYHAELRKKLSAFARGKRLKTLGSVLGGVGGLVVVGLGNLSEWLFGGGGKRYQWVILLGVGLFAMTGIILSQQGQKMIRDVSAFLRKLEKPVEGWECTWSKRKR
jgi:hypothetical protein